MGRRYPGITFLTTRKCTPIPTSLRAFISGMRAITYDAAIEFSRKAPEVKDVKTIVDLGGARALF